MSDVGDFIRLEINKQTRADALNVLKGVVLATPVDTGRARGNWQASINNPISIEIKVDDKAGGSTITKGLSAINQAKEINYPTLWIVNNLPYIGVLNDGSSIQAPSKFVETVIQKVINRG